MQVLAARLIPTSCARACRAASWVRFLCVVTGFERAAEELTLRRQPGDGWSNMKDETRKGDGG